VASFASGIGIAFYEGPIYALICLAYFPMIFVLFGGMGAAVKRAAIDKIAMTKKLGAVVEETLTAIKLVASFAQEDKEEEKFDKIA
jgi:ABC-type multidrug transport system fused ATPase/permease subunit